eukprot:m.99229 g.99229  ORF g.99229 m.99229 type:complete len:86 (-) comp15095_c0_seq1:354-611(-)
MKVVTCSDDIDTRCLSIKRCKANSNEKKINRKVKLYATCDSEDGYINGNPAFTANVLDQVVDACGLKVGCRSLSVPRYAYNPLQP